LREQLRSIEENSLRAKEEEDYTRFQFEQLNSAKLREGEQEELDSEWDILTHAEEIKLGLEKMHILLDNDDNGILANLKQVLTQAEFTKKSYSRFGEAAERLRSNYIDLKDLSSEIGISLNNIEINPARMEQVNERINLIYGLQQKHHVKSIAELISLRNELSAKLQKIESFDDEILTVKKELSYSEEVTIQNSVKLSKSRKMALKPLEERLTSLLVQLGIPKASLIIKIENKPLDSDGSDRIRFLFSANKNTSPQPIDEIASGGEISRIMLCIKSVLADSIKLSTLFFDEIDTGVSGEIAYKMGEIMRNIANARQVICITHLPQIAARGKEHFKVSKTENEDRNKTIVTKLTEDERLMEIAQMLSGANITDAAIRNAQSLLEENQH
jgi:DNA repair protein RecN (Recombination protein N)